MLHEHEVGLLAALGAPSVAEALRERDAVPRVVERKRGIGDDAVEAHQLTALRVKGLGERVPVLDVGVGDAVEEQVHLRDGPDTAVVLLAE